jgi:hypothetical protein
VQRSKYSLVACVELEPGHTYRTQAMIGADQWLPEVVDESIGKTIDPYCDPPHHPPPRTPGQDEEPIAAEESGRRPGTGLSAFFGFGFGGSDFLHATDSNGGDESLSAGKGFVLGLGAMVTPLWPSETVGLGLGVDGAFKYDGIDAANGSASITRYPVALTLHLLATGSGGQHYFLLKGGLVRDFGLDYRAPGLAIGTADMRGTLGPTGSVGYYRRWSDHFGTDIHAFFAITDHVVGAARFSANTFGVAVGFHLNR